LMSFTPDKRERNLATPLSRQAGLRAPAERGTPGIWPSIA
jgi:hypothetical protein